MYAASYPESCSWGSWVTTSDTSWAEEILLLCVKNGYLKKYSYVTVSFDLLPSVNWFRETVFSKLLRERTHLTWYYFIYCDIESCRFLPQPLLDLIYFWRRCLSNVLLSFWEEQHGYIFHICLSDLLTHWPVCSMYTRFVFVLLCNTCLNLRQGLNRCLRNTWLMFVLLFWYLNF